MTYFKSHSFCIAHKVSGNTWWKKSAFRRGQTHISSKSFLPTYKDTYKAFWNFLVL